MGHLPTQCKLTGWLVSCSSCTPSLLFPQMVQLPSLTHSAQPNSGALSVMRVQTEVSEVTALRAFAAHYTCTASYVHHALYATAAPDRYTIADCGTLTCCGHTVHNICSKSAQVLPAWPDCLTRLSDLQYLHHPAGAPQYNSTMFCEPTMSQCFILNSTAVTFEEARLSCQALGRTSDVLAYTQGKA
jgi:hypothetical protein